MAIDEKKLQRLIDRSEISDLLYRWASALARKDWPSVRAVFFDDCFDAHGTFDGGIDEFVEWQKRHHNGIEQSAHVVGPALIDFASDTLAMSESYCIAFHRYGVAASQAREDMFGPGFAEQTKPLHSVIVGRYLDRFEKREDVWKIAKRSTAFEWVRLEDAPWNIPFQPGWTPGTRDDSDPVYTLRREIGIL